MFRVFQTRKLACDDYVAQQVKIGKGVKKLQPDRSGIATTYVCNEYLKTCNHCVSIVCKKHENGDGWSISCEPTRGKKGQWPKHQLQHNSGCDSIPNNVSTTVTVNILSEELLFQNSESYHVVGKESVPPTLNAMIDSIAAHGISLATDPATANSTGTELKRASRARKLLLEAVNGRVVDQIKFLPSMLDNYSAENSNVCTDCVWDEHNIFRRAIWINPEAKSCFDSGYLMNIYHIDTGHLYHDNEGAYKHGLIRATTGNNEEINICDFYADGETNENLKYALLKVKEAGIDLNLESFILMGDGGAAINSTGLSASANHMKKMRCAKHFIGQSGSLAAKTCIWRLVKNCYTKQQHEKELANLKELSVTLYEKLQGLQPPEAIMRYWLKWNACNMKNKANDEQKEFYLQATDGSVCDTQEKCFRHLFGVLYFVQTAANAYLGLDALKPASIAGATIKNPALMLIPTKPKKGRKRKTRFACGVDGFTTGGRKKRAKISITDEEIGDTITYHEQPSDEEDNAML